MKKIILFIVFLFLILRLQAPSLSLPLYMSRGEEWLRDREIEEEYDRFIKDLGYRESHNNPETVNSIGCMGEYQFKESTLRFLGYNITLREFKKDPDIFPPHIQREAVDSLINMNWYLLSDYHYMVNDIVGGVTITKSGLLAAAHLGGAGSVKKFLQSEGKTNKKDPYGTSIRDYLEEFNGYKF